MSRRTGLCSKSAWHSLPVELSDSTGFLLNKAAQYMRERFERRLGNHGLAAAQVGILSVVASATVSTQREIGQILRIDRTTMVKLIDSLEDLKLIARKDNSADRRSYALRITVKGRTVLKRAMQEATRVEGILLRKVRPRDRQIFRSVLRAIAQMADDNVE